MKKKNKLILLTILLVLLIIICRSIFSFKEINYSLNIDGNKIKIKERYNSNNYYIELITDDNIYPFRIYNDNSKRKIVKNVYV